MSRVNASKYVMNDLQYLLENIFQEIGKINDII